MQTLIYYNTNATEFCETTQNVDMSENIAPFLSKLPEHAHILDFGCGSGRDTKHFLEKGYRVDAIDGSVELCRLASSYTGIEVKQMYFEDLNEVEKYDGIWACSSILHLSYEGLLQVLPKMRDALVKTGIIYNSFKYGDFGGERNGRYFTDFTEEKWEELVDIIPGISIEEMWITADVRPNREEEKWLNIILVKK